jgi:hypothetical protein
LPLVPREALVRKVLLRTIIKLFSFTISTNMNKYFETTKGVPNFSYSDIKKRGVGGGWGTVGANQN